MWQLLSLGDDAVQQQPGNGTIVVKTEPSDELNVARRNEEPLHVFNRVPLCIKGRKSLRLRFGAKQSALALTLAFVPYSVNITVYLSAMVVATCC